MTREERIRNLNLPQEEEIKFKSVYEQYERDEQKRGEKALQWKLEHLIPKSQLLLENRYSPRQEIKCLFVLVGTTVEPLLLSILTLRPLEKLVLIYSSESKKQKNIIENTLFQKPGSSLIQKKWLYDEKAKLFIEQAKNKNNYIKDAPITETTPEKVFAAIKSRIGSYQANEIGVDITGGKKSMVGGGFLAASINNFHLFYVDFDEYKDSQPVQGTEFIHILPNPFDIYNVREESLILELWERQDFDAVINVVRQTIEKLTEDKAKEYGLEKERNRLIQIQTAANCYREWSKFNYSEAKNHIDFNFYKNNHQDILSTLTRCNDLRKTVYGAILLAIDRWMRGVDAINSGDYNLASLRFTQVIECLCEFRIFNLYGSHIKSNDNRNLDPTTEWIGVSKMITFLFRKPDDNTHISNIKKISTTIKKGLQCHTTTKFGWEQDGRLEFSGDLNEIIDFRNDVAHFDCYSSDKNQYQLKKNRDFQDTIRSLLNIFIEKYQDDEKLNGKSFDDLAKPFKFAEFEDFSL